jgi:hypothetical protein
MHVVAGRDGTDVLDMRESVHGMELAVPVKVAVARRADRSLPFPAARLRDDDALLNPLAQRPIPGAGERAHFLTVIPLLIVSSAPSPGVMLATAPVDLARSAARCPFVERGHFAT